MRGGRQTLACHTGMPKAGLLLTGTGAATRVRAARSAAHVLAAVLCQRGEQQKVISGGGIARRAASARWVRVPQSSDREFSGGPFHEAAASREAARDNVLRSRNP